MCSKSVSTVDMSTMVAPLSAIQVEGQVSQLELTKLQSRHGAEHMQWKSEKDALLKQWQDELAVERQVAEGLRTELLDAQQQAAARAGELQVAVSALGDARRQLSARAGEVSQWRAEAARAVGKLETMTDHCERQNEQITHCKRRSQPNERPSCQCKMRRTCSTRRSSSRKESELSSPAGTEADMLQGPRIAVWPSLRSTRTFMQKKGRSFGPEARRLRRLRQHLSMARQRVLHFSTCWLLES